MYHSLLDKLYQQYNQRHNDTQCMAFAQNRRSCPWMESNNAPPTYTFNTNIFPPSLKNNQSWPLLIPAIKCLCSFLYILSFPHFYCRNLCRLTFRHSVGESPVTVLNTFKKCFSPTNPARVLISFTRISVSVSNRFASSMRKVCK